MLNYIKSVDWRITFGLCVTAIWVTLGVIYLLGVVGPDNFVKLPTADIGSFLEGAFAPLAFLWLVIGHFIQQREISANTKAISIQERSARRLEQHSRRDSYFKLLGLVQSQLGAIASFHYISICGPSGTGEMTQEEFTEQRSKVVAGDYSFFIVKMLVLAFRSQDSKEELNEIFFGTEIRERHTDNFISTFRRLLEQAALIDTNGLITNALLTGSAEGRYYLLILGLLGEDADPENILKKLAANANDLADPLDI